MDWAVLFATFAYLAEELSGIFADNPIQYLDALRIQWNHGAIAQGSRDLLHTIVARLLSLELYHDHVSTSAKDHSKVLDPILNDSIDLYGRAGGLLLTAAGIEIAVAARIAFQDLA